MNGYDTPDGMITRFHFYGYKPSCDPMAPPPMHVVAMSPDANWYPAPRPIQAGGHVGPPLNYGGSGLPPLGIDPTDPLTWEGRGYRQCAGMIGRLNSENDWRGHVAELNPLGMGR